MAMVLNENGKLVWESDYKLENFIRNGELTKWVEILLFLKNKNTECSRKLIISKIWGDEESNRKGFQTAVFSALRKNGLISYSPKSKKLAITKNGIAMLKLAMKKIEIKASKIIGYCPHCGKPIYSFVSNLDYRGSCVECDEDFYGLEIVDFVGYRKVRPVIADAIDEYDKFIKKLEKRNKWY